MFPDPAAGQVVVVMGKVARTQPVLSLKVGSPHSRLFLHWKIIKKPLKTNPWYTSPQNPFGNN